jgi:hypothetical protein
MRAPTFVVVALVAGGVLIGCGGDDDDEGGGGGSKQEQSGDLTRAAQRLETYLKENTKDLSGEQAPRGQVVSSVQPTDGKLKVFTRLNAEVTVDDDPAREVCRVVRASGVPEAKGAVVVDAGDALMERC